MVEAQIASLRQRETLTIIGFGSLQSIASARTTFPTLENFRVVRLDGFRRLFRHPAAIFFERGIANLEAKTISSLCAERADNSVGFTAVAFDVKPADVDLPAFFLREEEFSLEFVPFREISAGENTSSNPTGLMCLLLRQGFQRKMGAGCFDRKYRAWLDTIWGWTRVQAYCPAACTYGIAVRSITILVEDSFFYDGCVISTTVRQYLINTLKSWSAGRRQVWQRDTWMTVHHLNQIHYYIKPTAETETRDFGCGCGWFRLENTYWLICMVILVRACWHSITLRL